MNTKVDVVTGAFSNTGFHITRRLLAQGRAVKTLTGHPERRGVFSGKVEPFPYDFEHPDRLAETLKGVDTLYNGYWVRFDRRGLTYEKAVENTRILVGAAAQAGVRKIVQISIANASADSAFRYYKGKAAIEKIVRGSGLQYTLLKPTVIFGPDGILINNIAWLLKKFPIFMIPGDGEYRIQPIYVEDLADLAVAAGASTESRELDAVGPECFAYKQLVSMVGAAVGGKAAVVHVSRGLAIAAARALGFLTGDVVLTPEEVDGLMADVLVSKQPPTASTLFSQWLEKNKDQVGRYYLSEIKIHFDKEPHHG